MERYIKGKDGCWYEVTKVSRPVKQKLEQEEQNKKLRKGGYSRVELLKDGVNMQSVVGRKSVAEIAYSQGLFDNVTHAIEDYFTDNPLSTHRQFRAYMMEKFPTVFGHLTSNYVQQFTRTIERVPEWKEAKARKTKQTALEILQRSADRAKEDMEVIYDKSGRPYEIGMSDKDKLSLVNMLLDLDETEQTKQADVSEETLKTLVKLSRALNPTEPDEDEDEEDN